MIGIFVNVLSLPDIGWGKKSRVILDVGCGVASFGGYLFERDVLAMSLESDDQNAAWYSAISFFIPWS